MQIDYADFVKLLNIDDPKGWEPGLEVRHDGVYVVLPDGYMIPDERATAARHPTGRLNDPALRFPCSVEELEAFCGFFGLYGYINAFDFYRLYVARMPTETPEAVERVDSRHNPDWQANANTIAGSMKAQGNKSPSKEEVARRLHGDLRKAEPKVKLSSILRSIKKDW